MADTARCAVILEVDDDEMGRYVVTRLLQRAGHTVVEAASGRQALDLAARMSPDIIILDVNLPDIDGGEVARRLRADPATATIPILHLSATTIDAAGMAAGLESGADAYLCEPVDEHVLMAQVGTLLRMRLLHQEVVAARAEAEARAQQLGVTLEELQVATEELEAANEELRRSHDQLIRQQAAAAQQWALLQSIIDGSPEIVFVKGRGGRFLTINTRLEELLGRTREEVRGKTDYDLYPPELAKGYREQDRRVLATGAPLQVEGVMTLPDGPHTFLTTKFALLDAQGAAYAVCGMCADITDRKRIEQDREELQRQILAAERARAELAENLNREIAHRTKNNLAMVAGLLQLQMMQQRTPEAAAALSDAISRVMTFANIQQELQGASGGWVDLLQIVQKIAAASGEALAERRVTVSVTGDAITLPQKAATNLAVVANELVTNAAKHGAPGPDGRLNVQVEVQESGEFVRLRVWNSGNPMPAGFDLSKQRGMGLFLVRDLVGQYGGAFTLSPEAGGTVAEAAMPRQELISE